MSEGETGTMTSPSNDNATPNRLGNALNRFARLRAQLDAIQERERAFTQRCQRLLETFIEIEKIEPLREAVESVGDLCAFTHTDGVGHEINLILSPQRDRAIINERYLPPNPNYLKREGSDVLLAIQSLTREIDPNRCLIYQLLKPVELLAVAYDKDTREPRPFIESPFGIVRCADHMREFVQQLFDAPANPDIPLPSREKLPDYIEERVEDSLAASLEERLRLLEKGLS